MASSDAGIASSLARGSLFSIPAHRPFADDLAAGLLAQYPDPLALAHVLLLLPTRRAIRALTEAFVRESEGRALLLPRMVPAGDLDPEEAEGWEAGPLLAGLDGAAELRPAITSEARRVALAKLLSASRPAPEALALGAQLAAVLDTLEIEGVRAADIAAAVPEGELQAHWAANAKVLELVAGGWPELLAARGLMDPSRRRNLQMDALTARWTVTPPPFPVLLAGFASAPPAVARLAHTVARMPDGRIVLPGLDLSLDADGWALIWGEDGGGLETHPQYGMARLLAAADLSPLEAAPWVGRSERAGSPAARAELVSRALSPPALAGGAGASAEALHGLRMVEAANPAEEALVIALALRQVVEKPGATAALVTPDRALAQRVQVQLKRFGIEIDDSAGVPLAATRPGSLLLALAVAAGERFAPVSLLAALQHPLLRAGEGRLDWLNHVRALDRLALRGIRPSPGLGGVALRLRRSKLASDDLKDWWAGEATALLAPLEPLPQTADALLERLRAVAEAAAGPALWQGDAGTALARLFDTLAESKADLAAIRVMPEEAAAFVGGLMQGVSVRPRFNRHPQLAIWGPLEARLQTADLLVMAGLNEGTWPSMPTPDPFLAPAIRRALDLPGLARRTGFQAHDFAAGLGAREVLLTRSLREGGAPSVASRFWQRLRAAAGVLPDSGAWTAEAATLLAVARSLDVGPAAEPYKRPEPAPPAVERPRKLSVTEVATLKADPFSFYARHMLGLKPLDPRDAEPTAGERGQAVHRILERWSDEKPADEAGRLAIVDEELAKLGERPEIAALWRPRVLRMLEFVMEQQAKEPEWVPVAWEAKGQLLHRGVTLNGRVDRIDSNGSGLRILDYKTGAVPAVLDVKELWQTQLALLAAMAVKGEFHVDASLPVERLDYLKLSGGRDPGKMSAALGSRATAEDMEAHLSAAFADFTALVEGWLLGDRPFRAKQHMVYGRRFADYDHLARVAEWLGR
ncbi:double-strand break repair protein AddB [Sandaracinobacter neustonicus]|uniref:Double-strand break repair protein AddB n=1 Tax=Sandaracinobacter neustonicus TaxID=1715348 RepID=A0A501XP95_9SPHN|nr:double-strand break repair protein AddB [Sandaracinobacter neustonicus]TPE62289.1 double-strand break repair protein AddB [Sandaracinobacter neustonicus]